MRPILGLSGTLLLLLRLLLLCGLHSLLTGLLISLVDSRLLLLLFLLLMTPVLLLLVGRLGFIDLPRLVLSGHFGADVCHCECQIKRTR